MLLYMDPPNSPRQFTLWWLPALIALMTPIPYLAVLRATRNALITAFMTSSLFIVLPMLTDHARDLIARYGLPSAR